MVTEVTGTEPSAGGTRAKVSWGVRVWLGFSALVPALIAAGQLDLSPAGGRDAGAVVATVGLGYAGSFRALDVWLAAPFAALPLGTRMLRAELPGVLLLGATAALLLVLLQRVLTTGRGSPAWSSVVAAVATATVAFSYPFQHEAAAPASCLAGVVLVLAALVHLERQPGAASSPLLGFLFGLGLSYDPAIGVCIAAAALTERLLRRVPPPATTDPGPIPSSLRRALEPLLAAALGLSPFALATLHARVTPLSNGARPFAAQTGVAPATSPASLALGIRHAVTLLRAELGEVLLLLALAGFVWALLLPRYRRVVAPLSTVTVCASAFLALSMTGGVPDAWSAVGLVAALGIVAFAGVAMHEAVVRVARARLPLAAGSAAMVVLLESAFPAVLLDDWLARAPPRPTLALATWEDTAFGALPGGTRLLVSSPRLYTRLLATEATGALPADLVLIPTFDPSNEGAAGALSRDPRLVPLFRDLVLTGVPAELSMSTIATAMPLAVAADPRWERTLSRHLIPTGLFSLFEPEPRGGADRKHALDASASSRARLAAALGLPTAPNDAPLATLTARMLFDRALGALGTGEREVGMRALEDAAVFAPRDPRMARLMGTVASTKGPVEVSGLVHEGLAGEER